VTPLLPDTDYHVTEVGRGVVRRSADRYALTVPPVSAGSYHNAQISSYSTRREIDLAPPLRLTLRAHIEGDAPRGTAGFGFWNHPYAPNERGFRIPRATWFFFASPPNDMPLALDVPGYGWKAATFDAANWRFLALLPLALPGFLLMRIPSLYRALWPLGQRAIGVSERLLDFGLLHQPHDYQLDWHIDRVRFAVDGVTIHETDRSPRGPLGFVAWIDNQYAVVTPQGRFGSGLTDVPGEQTLVIESLAITQPEEAQA
jgi:hypothetical protein